MKHGLHSGFIRLVEKTHSRTLLPAAYSFFSQRPGRWGKFFYYTSGNLSPHFEQNASHHVEFNPGTPSCSNG